MDMTPEFDLITIGAGSGGVACSRRAASYGAKVAICEQDRVGGTCVLRGCVPKKLLVYGAQFAADFHDAAGFGWSPPQTSFDWSVLQRNKDHELDRLNHVYERLLHDSGAQIVRGRARLLSPNTVEVAGQVLRGRAILIATGSHPVLPPIPGIEHAITSNEALSLPALPRRIVIVGSGYIAVEFAGIFRGLGVDVELVVRGDGVLRGFDEDLRTQLGLEMRKRGVSIRSETIVRSIAREADGSLTLMTQHGELLEPTDLVMYAVGRLPNTAGLGLAEAGVRLLDNGAVVVDEAARTSVPGVYAVGDCTDQLNLTPVAVAQGRALADTLCGKRPRTVSLHNVPTAVFSQPPLATVGLSEAEARARSPRVDVYLTSFRPMRNTLAGRDERTLVKLVVDADTDRVLGCHMIGPDAPEIIQGLAVALSCGATKAHFDATIGIHPTSAEEFVTLRERRPPPPTEA
jgi:glutathione reductase (NADPH)